MKTPGAIIWLTGLSGSGKTTLAHALQVTLQNNLLPVEVLDGDVIRQFLSPGLGFSQAERNLNVQRVGFVANLLCHHLVIVIVAMISPYRAIRDQLKVTSHNLIEVFVNAPLPVCEARDPKGLYAKARSGEITAFTGIDDPYEPPLQADIICYTDREPVEICIQKIIQKLTDLNYIIEFTP